MNTGSIKKICELITDNLKEGDQVNLTITKPMQETRLCIDTAPSHILEVILANGYSASAAYGHIIITAEED